MQWHVRNFKDQTKLVEAAAGFLTATYEEAVKDRGLFLLALSGGRTPRPFYESLANSERRLSWKRIHLFMVDERFVTYDHPDSNWGMIQHALLDHIRIPDENLHPVPILANAAQSSAAYAAELNRFFQLKFESIPVMDMIILGLGEDGHTASLFPGSPELAEKNHLVVDVSRKEVNHQRISITLPVIRSARRTLFLVTGSSKAETVYDVVVNKNSSLPATLVCQSRSEIHFFLDREAAERLPVL